MLKRTLIGALALAVLVGAWLVDRRDPGAPAWCTGAIGALVMLVALDELLVMGAARRGRRMLGRILGAVWLALLMLTGLRPDALNLLLSDLLIGASLVAGAFLALQLRAGPGPLPHRLAGSLWFQLPYVGGIACLVSLLLAGALDFAVGVALVAKSSDIGAYFCGHAFGRRRLAPGISPHKSVEGAIGGLLLAALVAIWLLRGVELNPLLRPGLVLPADLLPGDAASGGALTAALHGLVIGALAIVSDLCESLLKRSRSVKDSGRLLGPGGGLLDLVDSLLLVGPIALAYTAVVA